jgi:hypothetical protein
MVFALAAATRRQSALSSGGENGRADQRKAERSHQHGCPDSTHCSKCTPKDTFCPRLKLNLWSHDVELLSWEIEVASTRVSVVR